LFYYVLLNKIILRQHVFRNGHASLPLDDALNQLYLLYANQYTIHSFNVSSYYIMLQATGQGQYENNLVLELKRKQSSSISPNCGVLDE
jgi:hypothetical protein